MQQNSAKPPHAPAWTHMARTLSTSIRDHGSRYGWGSMCIWAPHIPLGLGIQEEGDIEVFPWVMKILKLNLLKALLSRVKHLAIWKQAAAQINFALFIKEVPATWLEC